MSFPPATPVGAARVVICDYNQLLQSVTGLLRISGYAVFQAYDGDAADQLCRVLPEVRLLILNTDGTGIDTPALVRSIREEKPDFSVLHIGTGSIPGMPDDVPTISEQFTVPELLATVKRLVAIP